MKRNWVNSNGTSIEFIESQADAPANQTVFVIVPGLSESAEDYIPLMELFPRRCVAISLRGRGTSESPLTGYALEDHIHDIDTVIEHLKLDEFVLMGFSRGASYALGYTFTNLNSVKGLIIGDYPACHTQLTSEWVGFFSALPPWRGKSSSERMALHAIQGIQRESKQVLFWDKLKLITNPVLVITGGKEGTALTEEDCVTYLEKLSKAKLIVLKESAHNLFEPELGKFVEVVEEFIEEM